MGKVKTQNWFCSEFNCTRVTKAHGLCQMHYNRVKYIKNIDKIKAQAKVYRKAHPEHYKKYEKSVFRKFGIYKRSAKKRDLLFKLTLDEFVQYFGKKCSFCGTVNDKNGIDRIDSLKGYFIENVQPSCFPCNLMKRTFTNKEFVEKIQQIAINLELFK